MKNIFRYCLFVCVFALVLSVGFGSISSIGSPKTVFAAVCSNTSTGAIPLNDLGTGLYNGQMGGLYPNGSNIRPASHEAAGLLIADEIQPLNSSGQVDLANGHIGMVSIGMSNTNQEFEVFEYAANTDPLRNPRVTFINGAQHGQAAHQWANPNGTPWTTLATTIANEGLTNPQVQVAWIKLTIIGDDVSNWGAYPFPANSALFQSLVKTVVQNLKDQYPNVKLAYLSNRIYGGYGPDTSSPEMRAYEDGFGIKWLIEEQMNGDPTLSFTGSNPEAPFLSWGPYLWADGLGSDGVLGGIPGRLDGMEYACSDFTSDGLHPSTSGRQKVANQLVNFLDTDTTSQLWYVNPNPPPPAGTPYYVDFDGSSEYADVADNNSLSFSNGTTDTPLTFESWIRPNGLSAKQTIIGKWIGGVGIEYRFYLTSGIIRLDLRDQSTGATVSVYSNSLPALAGSWHHIAATYDGRGGATAANGVTFYLDGSVIFVTRANNGSYVAMENVVTPLQIGRESGGSNHFGGSIDELRMWNVMRTQNQIQSNLDTELSGTEPGLVAYWRFNEGIGATIVDDSPNENLAVTHNNPTWVLGGPMAPPAPDTTPPVISNIVGTNLTDTSITISFNTNEITTGWVAYTQGTSCPCTDVYSSAPGTSHVINMTGLTPSTTYRYEVKATDAAGNFQVGPTIFLTTLATPPDTTAPSVFITNPVTVNISGVISIEASATDNIGVADVQFKIDGVNVGAEDTTSPYSISWNSASVTNGTHSISAVARDAAGNTSTSSLGVNVSNIGPPGPSNPVLLGMTNSSSNSSTHTSQTIFPSANSLLIVSVSAAIPSGSHTLSISDTIPGTGTWTQVSALNTISNSWRASIFYVETNATLGSGTITVNSSVASNRWVMHVSQIANATLSSVRQSGTSVGTAATMNVGFSSALTPGSMIFGAVASKGDADNNITAGINFTELSENATKAGSSTSNTLQTQYVSSALSNVSAWSGLGTFNNAGVAIEIAP